MPPHAGHEFLIDFATSYCDDLTIFLCTLKSEPIPGDLRYSWICELFPSAKVVHITEEIPEASRDNPQGPLIWAQALREHLSGNPDFLFASESYGWKLADALGAKFVPVDPGRVLIGISASLIRKQPTRFWQFIPRPVRPFFVVKVAIDAGDQSQQIIRHLSELMETVYLPHFEVQYRQDLTGGGVEPGDSLRVLDEFQVTRAQEAQLFSLLRQSNRFLFLSLSSCLDLFQTPDRLIRFTELSEGGELPKAWLEATPAIQIHSYPRPDKVALEVIKTSLLAENG